MSSEAVESMVAGARVWDVGFTPFLVASCPAECFYGLSPFDMGNMAEKFGRGGWKSPVHPQRERMMLRLHPDPLPRGALTVHRERRWEEAASPHWPRSACLRNFRAMPSRGGACLGDTSSEGEDC